MNFKSIFDFQEYFKTEDDCLKYYKDNKFQDEIYCLHCKNKDKIYKTNNPKKYICHSCSNTFSIFKDTIFQDTKIPLLKWFYCIFYLKLSNKGISSVQMAKQLGVTQKTSWMMLHKIRNTFKQNKPKIQSVFTCGSNCNDSLVNTVEIDENYVGGKEKK